MKIFLKDKEKMIPAKSPAGKAGLFHFILYLTVIIGIR
jgi:hypothetical protein